MRILGETVGVQVALSVCPVSTTYLFVSGNSEHLGAPRGHLAGRAQGDAAWLSGGKVRTQTRRIWLFGCLLS